MAIGGGGTKCITSIESFVNGYFNKQVECAPYLKDLQHIERDLNNAGIVANRLLQLKAGEFYVEVKSKRSDTSSSEDGEYDLYLEKDMNN